MSLKKRMFRSNMMILFTALFSLMLMIVGVLVFFEDSLENQLGTISETRVEKHAGEVALLIDSGELNTAEELQKEVEKWGGQTEVFTFQKATVAGRELEEGEGYLVAAYFPEEDWIASSLTPSFYAFLAAILLAGTGGIILLLLLASVFTRRMNRMVMEPVDLLKAGAERVRDGNLKEDIQYQGEEARDRMGQTRRSGSWILWWSPGLGGCGKERRKSNFPTGSSSFCAFWQRIRIWCFRKKSYSRRSGDMIMWVMRRRFPYILTV